MRATKKRPTTKLARGSARHPRKERAAARLDRKEPGLRQIFEAAGDGIFVHDLDGNILEVNQRGCDSLGYSRQELLRLKVPDVEVKFRPADHPLLMEKMRQGLPVTIDGVHRRKDGTTFPVEVRVAEFESAGGRLKLAIVRDVTDRRRGEEQLRESEERYRELFENANDIIYTHDLAGNFTSANAAAERMTGYTRAEVVRMNMAQILPPGDLERTRGMLRNKIMQGGTTTYELTMLAKDGRPLILEVSTRLIRQQGQIVGVQGIARDITQRKEMEEALRASEAKERRNAEIQAAILKALPANVALLDGSGKIVTVNESWKHFGETNHFLGGQAEIGSDYLEECERATPGCPEAAAATRGIRSVLTGEQAEFNLEYSHHSNGETHWFRLIVTPVSGDEAVGAVVMHVDITEVVRLEERLRQSQKMEAVGRLAGGVAHDFNNLLTVITGYSELLLRGLGKGAPERLHAEEIRKAADQAAALTGQLLAFGRKQMLAPQVLDPNDLVRDMEKMLRRVIGEDIDLATSLAESLGCVRADLGQLQQVVLNLAINARDAMPHGGKLTIETSNVILDRAYARKYLEVQTGRYVLLAVSDTGCGMSQEVRSHLFEPFFTTKEIGKGTGLGLSTIYGIVKQSGGHVAVYSEPGQGTTFKVYLPQVDEAGAAAAAVPATQGLPGGNEVVLLVEDQDRVRGLTREVLSRCGYTVLEAPNGCEGLKLVQEHRGPIHLLMTDVVMPEMNGRALADRLASLRPEIRVLFTSGYTDGAVVRHGVLKAKTAFLQKPFTPDGLAAKVREVLDQ
jgi:two-component system, cell cycle sensor histidine kinase and response regulator CckA